MALSNEEFEFYQWELEMKLSNDSYDAQRLEASEYVAGIIDTAIAIQGVMNTEIDIDLPPRPDEYGGGGF